MQGIEAGVAATGAILLGAGAVGCWLVRKREWGIWQFVAGALVLLGAMVLAGGWQVSPDRELDRGGDAQTQRRMNGAGYLAGSGVAIWMIVDARRTMQFWLPPPYRWWSVLLFRAFWVYSLGAGLQIVARRWREAPPDWTEAGWAAGMGVIIAVLARPMLRNIVARRAGGIFGGSGGISGSG